MSPEQRKLGVMKWRRNNSLPCTQWKSVLQKLHTTEDSAILLERKPELYTVFRVPSEDILLYCTVPHFFL